MRVPAQFSNLNEIKEFFPKERVVGVGVTAYPRSALGYLLPNYKILSLLETADLGAIRQISPVINVEKDLGGELPEKFNTSSILRLPKVEEWFGRQKTNIFVYKDSEAIDREAQRLNLKILGTPGKIRKRFEHKKFFRQELVKAGLKPIQGLTLKVEELDEKKWDNCRGEFGEKLVFQLTDYSVGGGLGTFFINTKSDFENFKEFVIRRRAVRQGLGKVIEWVNVTKFIEGEAASILGCATKFGTVTGRLQKQIIDQPELAALAGRSGVWLGHDWNAHFSPAEQDRAEKLCEQWGDYLYQQGYKGVFGLDVAADKAGQVYPVECNSRYTGAFPMYTMMQINNHEMPLDVWHLLEWLGVDYEMDFDEVGKISRQPKAGAHIILHNQEDQPVKVIGAVKAGVYKTVSQCHSVTVNFVRPGFSLLDIKNDDEFVLADRIPSLGQTVKVGERMGKLMLKRQIIDDTGRLLPEIRQLVKEIYDSFDLVPAEA